MKIYHTETQEDYDALMVGLEVKGIETIPKDRWKNYKCDTVVFVRAIDKNLSHIIGTTYSDVAWAIYKYPDVPIIKYKAKADEKMKFTKENVYKVFSQYRKDSNFPFNDLQDEIKELDDTPEKVVVPKCFDEWFKEIEAKYSNADIAKTFALWKLCQQGFGHGFEGVHGKKILYETDLGEWLFKNKMLAIDAVLNGYTIKPEQLYYIPLPDLETADGKQQVLSKHTDDEGYFEGYFACCPSKKLKQRYTKDELEQVPEIYKPFAKPIEDEEE